MLWSTRPNNNALPAQSVKNTLCIQSVYMKKLFIKVVDFKYKIAFLLLVSYFKFAKNVKNILDSRYFLRCLFCQAQNTFKNGTKWVPKILIRLLLLY